MKNKTTRGRSQDRNKVAGKQDYEVSYEKEKMNTSDRAVKKAIKSAGNQREEVEKKLSGRS
jgi:Protein of unknown function (DUF3606)